MNEQAQYLRYVDEATEPAIEQDVHASTDSMPEVSEPINFEQTALYICIMLNELAYGYWVNVWPMLQRCKLYRHAFKFNAKQANTHAFETCKLAYALLDEERKDAMIAKVDEVCDAIEPDVKAFQDAICNEINANADIKDILARLYTVLNVAMASIEMYDDYVRAHIVMHGTKHRLTMDKFYKNVDNMMDDMFKQLHIEPVCLTVETVKKAGENLAERLLQLMSNE